MWDLEAGSVLEGRQYNAAALTVAICGLVVTAIAAYYARRALFPPRRRITISVPSATHLLRTVDASINLSILLNGERIHRPHLVRVLVSNTGRYAIESARYDKDRAIMLDLGVPILAVLEARGTPPNFARAESVRGTRLLLGPELIQRAQTFAVDVIAEGLPSPVQAISFVTDTEVTIRLGEWATSLPSRIIPTFLVVVPIIVSMYPLWVFATQVLK